LPFLWKTGRGSVVSIGFAKIEAILRGPWRGGKRSEAFDGGSGEEVKFSEGISQNHEPLRGIIRRNFVGSCVLAPG
jgi:hypothetical protein